jgi:molybdopterin-binding protein
MNRTWLAIAFALAGSVGWPADAAGPATIPAGIEIPVATTSELSSRSVAKGDIVALVTTADVTIEGHVAVPKGTPVTGHVAEARSTGGMGVSGRLLVQALYFSIGGKTVRLSGQALGERAVGADTVIGMLLLTSVISGKSAKLPAGSPVPAFVVRTVELAR